MCTLCMCCNALQRTLNNLALNIKKQQKTKMLVLLLLRRFLYRISGCALHIKRCYYIEHSTTPTQKTWTWTWTWCWEWNAFEMPAIGWAAGKRRWGRLAGRKREKLSILFRPLLHLKMKTDGIRPAQSHNTRSAARNIAMFMAISESNFATEQFSSEKFHMRTWDVAFNFRRMPELSPKNSFPKFFQAAAQRAAATVAVRVMMRRQWFINHMYKQTTDKNLISDLDI